jgi:DNA polymerase delta subunit 1
MVVFQAIAWEAQDRDEEFTITAYGRAEDGKSVSVSFPFEPYFFVKSRIIAEVQRDMPGAKYELVQGKTLWGFTNSEQLILTKVTCKTQANQRMLANRAKWKKYQVFEANIDPLLRFFHRSGIKSAGWLEANGLRAFHTTCNVDLTVESWRNLKPVDRDDLAPLKIASLDIECYSDSGTFPDAEKPADQVFQIAISIGQDSWCLSLGKADGCRLFATERDLLQGFKDLMEELDPDIVTGWNIFGFDLEYLYKRMVILNCDPDTFCWGRRRETSVELVVKQLASSALGQNVLKMVPMSGRYTFDLFQTVKAEHRLESYSLNSVSREFLGESKNDMPIKELFRMFRDGEDLTRVADYCKQDTALPLKLMKKLFTVENLIEMAKATWVPLSFLSERGQQIKVFSQIAKTARELGFFIPSNVDSMAVLKKLNPGKSEEELTKFEGATVLEAQTGAYFKPIVALDFASLYPSIMMAHNLCYSTLVMDPRYADVPGITYEQHGPYLFAQNVPSLLPKILADLKEYRKQAKRDMKAQPELYNIYNSKQLAYKISMNSVYGFTGALKGMLSCLPIASSVTRKGRDMIQASKEYVEANFPGAKVRYGDTDSIMVEFGPEDLEECWKLGERASREVTAIFKRPNDLELEKIYWPYVLYSKKRYAAKMWVHDGSKVVFDHIDVKGLQVVRRDNCEYVRSTCQKVIEMLLNSEFIEVNQYVAKQRDDLIRGRVPMERLVMSKRLGAEYKNNNLAHVVVRDKIKSRMPGSEPMSGDRVQFVLVAGGKKMYEKAEDPTWARDHRLRLDYQYYLKHQFEGPISDLLEPLGT